MQKAIDFIYVLPHTLRRWQAKCLTYHRGELAKKRLLKM